MRIRVEAEYKPWLVAHPDEELEPTMSCVYIDPKGFMVASDRWALACVPCIIEEAPAAWEGFILSAKWLARAHKERKDSYYLDLTIDLDAQEVNSYTKLGKMTDEFKSGLYPNWRACFKATISDPNPDISYGYSYLNNDEQLRNKIDDLIDRGNGLRSLAVNPDLFQSLCSAIGWSKTKKRGTPAAFYITAPNRPLLVYGNINGVPTSRSFGLVMPGNNIDKDLQIRDEIRYQLSPPETYPEDDYGLPAKYVTGEGEAIKYVFPG